MDPPSPYIALEPLGSQCLPRTGPWRRIMKRFGVDAKGFRSSFEASSDLAVDRLPL
jgi:hypothetical protein